MRSAILMIAIVGWLMCAARSGAVDEHTTFVAHYDTSVQADYSAGDWSAVEVTGGDLVAGKLGKALQLQAGRRLSYSAEGKINAQAGTIQFWTKWLWEPGTRPEARYFNFSTPGNNYLNFNTVATDRLGIAVNGGPADDHVWRRVDFDPADWQPGQWHHLAGTWLGGELRLYVDGKLADEVTDGEAMVETPGEFTIGPGPVVIDELSISDVARSEEEIAAFARATPEQIEMRYLSSLPAADSQQPHGTIGSDAELAVDDRRLPLVIGSTAYARGIAVRIPGYVEFQRPAWAERLQGVTGVSRLSPPDNAVHLSIEADDQQVFDERIGAGDEAAREFDVSVGAADTIRLRASGDGDKGGVAVFADAKLLAEGVEPPGTFARSISAEEIELQSMRKRASQYEFAIPDSDAPYVIYGDHPVDMIDVREGPPAGGPVKTLNLRAAPGEYEAAQFVICARKNLDGVRVTCRSLHRGLHRMRGEVQVKLIGRVLQRRLYQAARKPENYEVVSRFLFPNREFWLPAGHLKQVYLLVRVPRDATPGMYAGRVEVQAEGVEPTTLEVRLRVWPIELLQAKQKRVGCYYGFRAAASSPEILAAELADIAAHGGTTMVPHVGVEFTMTEDGSIAYKLDGIRHLLEALRRHGFAGKIPIQDEISDLAHLLGLQGITDGSGKPLADESELLAIARQAFAELRSLDEKFNEFEIVLTHMDEVFSRDRMPRYLDIARVVRKASDFKLYMTIHMMPGRWEEAMAQSDDYIDVRCINGHSLEAWLRAGNDFDQLRAMLEKSGDEAWLYHNMRGSFFRAEWNRIINGLWMWVSPISVHAPWIYYSYGGDPFDDTDAEQFDYGYAFPIPGEPTKLVSTLHWEAFREGYDDMRYLLTLERLIERAEEQGVDASDGKQWLRQVRDMLPKLPEDIAGIEQESPLCVAIADEFDGDDYDRLRWNTAERIMALQGQLEATQR